MIHAKVVAVVLGLFVIVGASMAGAQAPPPYGAPLTLEQAKKAMAAAEAEARKNNWDVVIVIVDSGGNLVMLQRFDNAHLGVVDVARDKARTAVAFRRPTKAFQDAIAQGGANLRLLNLVGNAGVVEGGVLILGGGKIIGGVGVAGATGPQDAQIAQAGADALK